MSKYQEQALTATTIGIRRFYRLIRVLKDLKVIPKDQGYILSNVHKYSETLLNIKEDKMKKEHSLYDLLYLLYKLGIYTQRIDVLFCERHGSNDDI